MTTTPAPAPATPAAAPAAAGETGAHGPVRSCWADDDHWHAGKTKIELPSDRYLKAFWHAEILDIDSANPLDRIIERRDPSWSGSASSSKAGCGGASAATGASTSASRRSAGVSASTCPSTWPTQGSSTTTTGRGATRCASSGASRCRAAPYRSHAAAPSTTAPPGSSRVDLLTAGHLAGPLIAARPADLAGPVRLDISVSGTRRGHEIHLAARILRVGEPGWNPQDPVVIKGPGRTSLDLAPLPAGQHDITVAAWTPDGSAIPAAVTLPSLTIRPAPEPPAP